MIHSIRYQTAINFKMAIITTAMISLGMMLFEIILTRIFSFMLSYNYVFLILSMAMLGLGFGGLLLKKWYAFFPMNTFVTNAAMSGLSMAGAMFIIIAVPLYNVTLLSPFLVWIYVFIAALPFFFVGMTLAGIFQEFPDKSALIYGFDLLGATLGTVLVIPVLDSLGAINGALFSAFVTALAAYIISLWVRGVKWSVVFSILFILGLTAYLNTSGRNLGVPLTKDINKDMGRMLNNPLEQAEIVESRWSAFGRTDLVASRSDTSRRVFYVDGSAGTAMYNINTLLRDSAAAGNLKYHFGEFFPFFFLKENERDNALILGPGGGRDVAVALLGQVDSVTAVEVNPDLVQLMRDYSGWNGGLYTSNPRVRIVVGEGRNFVMRSQQNYDLVMLALPVTKSSRSIEGYALTENYLFTVEAIRDYLDHLTDEGRLIVVAHNDVEIFRLLTLALKAFERAGVENAAAMKHIYTVASGMMPTIVIKKKAFTPEEAEMRHRVLHRLGFDRGNVFMPYVEQVVMLPDDRLNTDREWRMFNQAMVDISAGRLTLDKLTRATLLDISPVDDDSPFFYKFEPGLPQPFALLSLLLSVFVLAVLYLLFNKTSHQSDPDAFLRVLSDRRDMRIFMLIFILSGSAFMLLEIAFLQKLNLFIGQPVKALSVLLFSLLLGTGLGSVTSARFKNLRRAVLLSATGVAVLSLIVLYILPGVMAGLAQTSLRAALLLVPVGFLAGMPFPLAIRWLAQKGLANNVHNFYGFNGLAAVAGSILSVISGILAGFSYAVYLAAAFYLVLAGAALLISRNERPCFKIKQTTPIHQYKGVEL